MRLLYTCRLSLSLIIIILFCIIKPALAVQMGVVLNDGAEVHAGADASSAVLQNLTQGQKIKLSNAPRNGWYATTLDPAIQSKSGKKIGWIHSRDAAPEIAKTVKTEIPKNQTPKDQSQQVDNSQRGLWSVAGFYSLPIFQPTALQSFVGVSTKSIIGSGAGIELGHRMLHRWHVLFHFEFDSFSQAITYNDEVGNYSGTSTLALGLFKYDWLRFSSWRSFLAFGGGAAIKNKLKAGLEDVNFDSPTYTSAAGMVKIGGMWTLRAPFSVIIDVGYRYIRKKGLSLAGTTVSGEMSGLFLNSGISIWF
jgi:hypothetical protein